MNALRTTWTSGGKARSLTTTQEAHETPENFAKRHAQDLTALTAVLPADLPPPPPAAPAG